MRLMIVTTAALAALAGASAPAAAFPPTATISPGYDRALAQSRRARMAEEPVFVAPPVDQFRKPRAYRHKRR